MPKLTAICYLSSILFYGMGSLKMLNLNEGHWNTHDVFLATVSFVLAIFFIVLGSVFFVYDKVVVARGSEFSVEVDRKLEAKIETQGGDLTEFRDDLYSRMTYTVG